MAGGYLPVADHRYALPVSGKQTRLQTAPTSSRRRKPRGCALSGFAPVLFLRTQRIRFLPGVSEANCARPPASATSREAIISRKKMNILNSLKGGDAQ